MKNLNQWLEWAANQHKRPLELGLSRIQKVADYLNIRQAPCPVITVAGTNGKGSTVALLTAMALAADKKVGSFTSPHLLHFNERIALNGQPCTYSDLLAGFSAVEKALQHCDIPLTFFEITTLVALWIFQHQVLDLWVLEVGLGGRLDAVNCIDADVAIITSIDLDHQAYLGNTREAIGREKAGIIRANKPVIYGDTDMLQSVQQIITEKQAYLYQWQRHFWIEVQENNWLWHGPHGQTKLIPASSLLPSNVGCALMALCSQLNFTVDEVMAGISKAQVPGRWQRFNYLHTHCYVDVAHNEAAIKLIAHRLRAYGKRNRWRVVFSCMADKAMIEMVTLLKPFVYQWYVAPLVTGASHQQPTTLLQLKNAFITTHIKNVIYGASIPEVFTKAVQESSSSDKILVLGSFYTVAEVLKVAGINEVSQLLSAGE